MPVTAGRHHVTTEPAADRIDDPEVALGNLPVQITPLLGRDQALEELSSILWRTRLLTLSGPGGVGKSRLAAGLSEAIRADIVGGAWWADLTDLADTADPGRVAQTVAATLLPGEQVNDPTAAVARRLAAPSLLVLDNCEHVANSTATLALDLLGRAPALRIIVTSRQSLGIPGEQVWRAPGLSLDDGAVALFFQRATEAGGVVDPDSPATRAAAREICALLDGLPLAIELAAARSAVLSVEQIAERLRNDTTLLRQTRRTVPGRHRTLQDTLEWSHQLLAPAEQRLFRRLAVFHGNFSLRAAEAVCADELLPPEEILDLLTLLIDQSLVQMVESPSLPRYRMLGTLRRYGLRKLEASGELEATVARHVAHYHALVPDIHAGLAGPQQVMWVEGLELDHDNLSDALERLYRQSPEQGAELACALWPFYYQRGYYDEARRWFEAALDHGDRLSPSALVDALLKAGEVTFLQCDYVVAAGHLERTLQLVAGERGDARAEAVARQRLGTIAREQGRYEEARRLHEQSLAIWERLGEAEGVASSQNYLGFVAWLRGDFEGGEAPCAAALATFRRCGNVRDAAATLISLGAMAIYRGDVERAAERLGEALAISRQIGFQEGVAWSLNELSILARRHRRAAGDAGLMLRDALLVHQQLGDRWRMASVLEEIGGWVLARRDGALAVRLLACSQALRTRIGAPVPPAEAPDREAAISRLRRQLNPAGFASAWAEGTALEVDQAVAMAVEAIERVGADAGGDGATAEMAPILTPRELAVLELLSQGHTNREIAGALYISPSTAGVHVSNILRKLRAKRRADAAGRAHALGLLPSR